VRLDALGFEWDASQSQRDTYQLAWNEGYDHLVAYHTREGDCRVPRDHKENGHPLGVWVNNQRQLRREGTLAPDRIQRRDALGFVWNAREAEVLSIGV